MAGVIRVRRLLRRSDFTGVVVLKVIRIWVADLKLKWIVFLAADRFKKGDVPDLDVPEYEFI
ncbi:hypothetical protein GCM10027566_32520 [Arachidicoccus ginsenosidivorans]